MLQYILAICPHVISTQVSCKPIKNDSTLHSVWIQTRLITAVCKQGSGIVWWHLKGTHSWYETIGPVGVVTDNANEGVAHPNDRVLTNATVKSRPTKAKTLGTYLVVESTMWIPMATCHPKSTYDTVFSHLVTFHDGSQLAKYIPTWLNLSSIHYDHSISTQDATLGQWQCFCVCVWFHHFCKWAVQQDEGTLYICVHCSVVCFEPVYLYALVYYRSSSLHSALSAQF